MVQVLADRPLPGRRPRPQVGEVDLREIREDSLALLVHERQVRRDGSARSVLLVMHDAS